MPEPENGAAYFGREVEAFRNKIPLTQAQLAEATHYQRPYVTRVEKGTLLASEQFAQACDDVFGTPGTFARLRERIRQSDSGHPAWFVPYVDLEQTATSINNYSPTLIMGMLQTEGYAEAVFRAAHPRDSAEGIKKRVEARVTRQEVLNRSEPPLLWVVLHEACLQTVVGGPAVMQGQLAALQVASQEPHITVQVLPFRAGAPASHLPFIVLTHDDGPAILYTEGPQHGRVDDSASAVADAEGIYKHLCAAALSPDDSLAMIRQATEAYER